MLINIFKIILKGPPVQNTIFCSPPIVSFFFVEYPRQSHFFLIKNSTFPRLDKSYLLHSKTLFISHLKSFETCFIYFIFSVLSMRTENYNLDPFLGNSTSEMDAYITAPLFSISDLGISKQDLLCWKEEGILDKIEDTAKFSFVEYSQIKIIQQLKLLGTQTNTIQNVLGKVNSIMNWKAELIELQKNPPSDFESKEAEEAFRKAILSIDPETLDETKGISLLQYLIGLILGEREQVHIVVYPQGDCVFPWYEGHAYTYTPEELERITYQPHIKISLTAIIREFISSEKAAFNLPLQYRIRNPEYHLIDHSLSGIYSEILVQYKNGGIDALQITEQVNPKEKITKILNGSDFMNVFIAKHDGRISKILSTHKIRF
jgi:hypothetical protein